MSAAHLRPSLGSGHPGPVEDGRRTPMRAATAFERVEALQRSAGNAAVSALMRETILDAGTPQVSVRIEIGTDVTVELARAAQAVAEHGMTDEGLRRLRTEALVDETISDTERMFIAGLYEPANAQMLSHTPITAGNAVRFDRNSILAHLAHVRDREQQTMDPSIGAELSGWMASSDFATRLTHMTAAERATLTQMARLVGPRWLQKVRAALAFADGRVSPVQILEAMLAAASDDTEGDRALAAVVFVVAATAGDPMTDNVRTGLIKVDEVTVVASGRLAGYGSVATRAGGKGDTITVSAAFDIDNIAHRGAIVHELRHAAQDAAAGGGKFQVTELDRAEADAYRAGARFELAQVADMSFFARARAARQLGDKMNGPKLLAMILESQTDPERFVPVLEEINAAWTHRIPSEQLRIATVQPARDLEQVLMQEIRANYRIHGPETNRYVVEGFAGENVFDSEDRL